MPLLRPIGGMHVSRSLVSLVLAAGAFGAAPALCAAQSSSQDSTLPPFSLSEEMIPMRDGVRLHTMIVRPDTTSDTLPILITRTPYGIAGSLKRVYGAYADLARDGYIFVFQDIRGRFGSEGSFVMNRPLHDPSDPLGVDESTDAYDTVEWLLRHVPRNNGRVGVLGVSYPGWLAAMAGINPHPAVKAISPQAPMTDTWIGDDFFHQGAFRLSYGFEYATALELSKDLSVPPPIGTYDTYRWYLSQGPLQNLTDMLAGRSPTWNNFVAHPTYDSFWQRQALTTYLTQLSVPTLTVGGWWDQEDLYGALTTYATLEQLDTAGINYLVMGPWNHGGWERGEGRMLGDVDFGEATGRTFRQEVQATWFDYWLKDGDQLGFFDATIFENGVNRWRSFDEWPPREAVTRNLYFHENGVLSFEPPAIREGKYPKELDFDEYVSDPAHPVPYRHRPIERTYDDRGSRWYTWLAEDQRFVDDRADVLTWQTEPLDSDVEILGDMVAHLFASTTQRDADWVVKLIDVFPDSSQEDPKMSGYQLMVAADILRGRYRHGFDQPEPVKPKAIEAYTIDLHQQSYVFSRGHRIMVQIQSTWFPLYDRNPQKWVPNIFEAKPEDFKTAKHRIYHSAQFPSHIAMMLYGW